MFNKIFKRTGGSPRGIFGMLRKNLKRNCLLGFLCAVLLGCAVFSCVNLLNNKENDLTADAGIVVTGNTYQISGSPEEMAAGWAQAVAASSDEKRIEVQLENDWKAPNGVFGANNPAFKGGALCVPAGKNVLLNLRGFALDRGLTSPTANGSVIVVQGKLYLYDNFITLNSSYEESRMATGKITGGYTTGNGGGVLVDGGTLEIAGAIYGNKAQGNGGGVYINSGNVSAVSIFAKVLGNTDSDGNASNVYLKADQKISVTDNLGSAPSASTAKLGVTKESGGGVITEKYGTHGWNRRLSVSDIFFADDYENYKVKHESKEEDTATEAEIVAYTPDKSSLEFKWNAAIMRSLNTHGKVTFKLEKDWVAEDETVFTTHVKKKFGNGVGFIGGSLNITYGEYIELDLNGNDLNRNFDNTKYNSLADVTASDGALKPAVISVYGGQLDVIDSTAPYTQGQQNYVSGKITGGTIPYTKAGFHATTDGGSGIFSRGGVVHMYSGTVSGNFDGYGGGLHCFYGAIYLHGGLVTENKSYNNGGGGAGADNFSLFEMDGGEVSNNTSFTYSGGIAFWSNSSTCRITGGIIRNNRAATYGGGIYLKNGGTLYLQAAAGKEVIIEDNICNYGNSNIVQTGGGIRMDVGTKMMLSGKVIIRNNTLDDGTQDGVVDNLYLATTATNPIVITGSLEGSDIGVTAVLTAAQQASDLGAQITSGYESSGNAEAKINDYFKVDDSDNYKITTIHGSGMEVAFSKKTSTVEMVALPTAIANVVYNPDINDGWQDIIKGYDSKYLNVNLVSASTTAGCTTQNTATTIQGNQAGTYVLAFSLADATHKWADGSTAATRNVTAKIEKATYDISGVYMENKQLSMKNTTVADRKIELNGISKLQAQGLSVSGYTYKKEDGTEIAQTDVTVAGSYTVIANIAGADTVNYNALPQFSAVLTMADAVPLAEPLFTDAAYKDAAQITIMFSTSSRTFGLTNYDASAVRVINTSGFSHDPATGNIRIPANAKAGTHEIDFEILDKNKYVWADGTFEQKSVYIVINNYDFGTVTATGETWTYDGTAHNAVKDLTAVQDTLKTTVSWQYKVDNGAWNTNLPQITDAGTYTVYYRAQADGYNTKGGDVKVTVNKRDISKDTLALSFNQVVFNGAVQKIAPAVANNSLTGKPTIATDQYSFTYTSTGTDAYKKVGTYNITVNAAANGNYTGSKSLSFQITAMDLSTAQFAAIADQTYTGGSIKPTTSVSIKLGNDATATALSNGVDYSWDYDTGSPNLKDVGTATIRINAVSGSNYKGSATVTFKIVAAKLYVELGHGSTDLTYNDTAKKPTTVSFMKNGSNTVLGTDGGTIDTAAILANVNFASSASGYDSSITKPGNYVAKVTLPTTGVWANYVLDTACNAYTGYSFTIKKATIADSDVTIAGANWTYDGTSHNVVDGTPSVNVIAGNSIKWEYSLDGTNWASSQTITAASDTDYTVNYKITVENYEVKTGTITVKVARRNLDTDSSLALSDLQALTYNGAAQIPTYKLVDNGLASASKELAVSTDYTVTYSDNTNAGTASAVFVGKGNFVGTKTLTFTIAAKNLSTAEFVAIADKTYTGGKIRPTTGVSIKLGNNATATNLTDGVDYSWDYDTGSPDITNVGTPTIRINAVSGSNYTGSATVTFKIVAAKLFVELGHGSTDLTYNDTAKKPTTVSFANNGSNTILGTDGSTITEAAVLANVNFASSASGYDSNIIKAGEYVAKVTLPTTGVWANYVLDTACNAYTGYKFTIKKATIADGDVTIAGASWTYDGTAHSVLDGVPSVSVIAGNTIKWEYSLDGTNWATSQTITNASDNDYTVNYRITVDNYEVKTGTFTVKVARRNLDTDSNLAFEDLQTLTYNGLAQVPTYKLVDNGLASASKELAANTDYTVTYSDNTNAGTASAKFEGKGNFVGTKTLTFTIAKKELTVTWTGAATYTYNKQGQGCTAATPDAQNGETVTLTVTYTGTDYIGNNYDSTTLPVNAAASYTATVTLDDGYTNYVLKSGETLTKTFEIKKKEITAVDGITAADKQYDGGNTATLDWSAATFGSAVCAGDELIVSAATGTFTNVAIGQNKVVNISGIEIASKNGDDVHLNYVLTDGYTTTHTGAEITRRVITITWTGDKDEGDGKVYIKFDGTSKLPTATAGNLVEGETLTLTVSASGTVSSNPGDYKAQAAIASGTYAANYELPEVYSTDFTRYSDNMVVYVDTDGIKYDGTAKSVKLVDGDGKEYTSTESASYTITYAAKVGSSLTDGKPVNAGEYIATITISAAYMWWDNEDFSHVKTIEFTVEKAEADVSGVSFEIPAHTYNGALPQIAVDSATLPAGVEKVEYAYFKGSTQITAAEAVNCGVYNVVASFVLDGNHKFVGATTTKTAILTVNKAPIDLDSISFADTANGVLTVVYDGKAHGLALSGTADGITGVTFTYTQNGQTVAAENVKNYGTYNVSAAFTADSNHEFVGSSYKNGQIVINKAPLTVIANDNVIFYGEEPSANGAIFNGLVAGENESVLGSLTFNMGYARYADVGTYAIEVNTFTGSGAVNYDIKYENGTLTVKPFEISVSWQRSASETSTDLVYTQNGTQTFCPYPVINEVINGDVISLEVSGATSVAGFGYEAKVTDITGAKSQNYCLPVNGIKVNFDILPEPKSGKIIWDNDAIYYDGTAQLPKAYYYETDESATPVELDVTYVGSTAPVNAGNYTAKINTSLNLAGDKTKDFTILQREIYIEIDDLTVNYGSKIDLSGVTYDYLDGSLTFPASENYEIKFTCDCDGATGTYAIVPSFICSNAANYNVTFIGSWTDTDDTLNGKCATLTVKKASFSAGDLTFVGTEATYDGTAHELTVLGLPDDIATEITYSKDGWNYAGGAINAGTYTVTVNFVYDSSKYDTINPVTVQLVIKKAALEIKANDSEIYYGDEATDAGYTVDVSGFAGEDDESVLGGVAQYSFGSYTAASPVGSYLISLTGITADNYEITFVPGSLTVKPRVITVTWFDYENGNQGTHFEYSYTDGATTYAPYAVAGGAVNGETVTLTVSGGKSAAGKGYIATAVLSNGNYALPADGTATVTFDVIPSANNVVIWVNEALVYGEKTGYIPEATYFIDGNEYSATVTVYSDKQCTSVATVNDAGTYYAKATASGESLTNDVFEFIVQPREITVQIENASAKFGAVSGVAFTAVYADGSAQFLAADGTIQSLINITCTANDNSPVGNYTVSGEYNGNANYKVTVLNGTLTVEKAEITSLPHVTVSDFTYDGKAHEITVETSTYIGLNGVNIVYFDGKGNAVASVVDSGDYSVKVTFIPEANYAFADGVQSEVTVTFKVKPAPVSGSVQFAAGDVEFTYDGKPHTPYVTGSATGLKEVKYTYYKVANNGSETEIAAEDVKNAGKYSVKAELVFDDKNYEYAGASSLKKEFKIIPATLTVKASDKTAVYGETVILTAADAEISGLVSGETLADIGLVYTVTTTYVAGNPVNNYDLIVTVTATAANYTVDAQNGTLTVTPKVIQAGDLEWFSNAACNLKDFTYIYDGATAWHPYAKVKSTSLLVGGDTLNFTYSAGKTDIGFGYTVEIISTGNANYVLPVEGIKSCSFDVLENPPKEFEIIWDYAEKYYNGEAHKPQAYYYDENGDRQELTVTVDEGNAVNVGTYTARVVKGSLKLTGNDVMNFSVEKRKVIIRVGNASAIYGETPNMNGVSWSYENEADETTHVLAQDAFDITFTCEAVSGIGKYKIFAQFASSKGANYSVEFTGDWTGADGDNGKCGVLTVAKANVDLSGVVYGNTHVTYDGTVRQISLNGVPAGVTYKLDYTDGIYGYGDSGVKNAGVYTVNVTFEIADAAEKANYNAIPVQTVTFEITKAPLTVKANDNAIVYGDEPSSNGIDWANAGFVNGETADTSDLQGGVTYVYNYNRYGAVGKYKITPAGLTSDNYEITFAAGTLSVEKRVITVEWFDDASRGSKTFSYEADGAEHAPYAVAGNLVNGDKVTLTVSGGTAETGVGHLATVTGIDNANYAIPVDGTQSVKFDIVPAANTVVWGKTPLYYDGTAQKPAAYYFDESGVRHTLTVTVDEAACVNAGTYHAHVTASGLQGDKDYTYEIHKLSVRIVIKDVTASLNGTIPFESEWWTYSTESGKFVNGDGANVTYGTLTTDNAGTFDITATLGGANAGNYDFSFEKGTLTVEKAQIAAPAFADGSVNYDGNAHKHEIASVPAGLTVTYTYEKDGVNYGSNGVKEVGVYTVTASFVADGNHIAPADVTSTFEIKALEIDLENCGIKFEDVTDAIYNGYSHKILTGGSADGVTGVTYSYLNTADNTAVAEGNVINAGTYLVTATYTADGNHTFKNGKNTLTAHLTIGKATVTVKANDVTVVYGDAANTNGYTVSGLAVGDTENSIGLKVTLSVSGYTPYTTNVGDSGAVIVTVTGLTSQNYDIATPVNGTLTVIPREITAEEVQWYLNNGDANPAEKLEYTHDGANHLPYAKAVINGVTVEFTITGAQKEIGDNYTATITAVDGNNNFTLPVGGIEKQFSIMAATKSGVIIWDNTPLYYNSQNLKPKAYYLLDGDDETKHYLEVTVSGNSKAVGTYTASVNPDSSLNLTGSKTMTFKVLALPVVIEIGDVFATYGETVTFTDNDWSYANGNHFIDGESFTINLTYGGATDAGKYKISGEFHSANSANYDVTFVGGWQSADGDNGKFGTLTINKATIDISALTVTGTSVNYDGKVHGVEVVGLPAGVTANYRYSLGGYVVANNQVIGAGEYDVTITFTVADADNFNTVPQMTAKLVINKSVITVTAYDNEIVYGDKPAASAKGNNGFIGSEIAGADLSDLKGTLTYTFDYKQYGNVGKYRIIPGGLTSDNYKVNFVAGVLTVKPRVITISWFDDDTLGSKNFKYDYVDDSTYFLPYASAGNLVNGDKLTLTVDGAAAAAGLNYVATVKNTNNANYALPSDGTVSQTFDIVPRSKVVVWDNTQLYYTGSKQHPAAYYFDENGVRHDLEVSVNGDTQGVAAVGSNYLATVTDTTGLSGSFSLQFSILPREITVIVVDKTVEYGKVSQVVYEVKLADGSTLVGEDTLGLFTTVCTANNSSEVGTYEIRGNYAGGNYTVTFVNGTLTVTKAKISVSGIEFNGGSLPYDGGVHKFEVSGVLPDYITGVTYAYYLVDGGTETYVGTDGVKNAGAYRVVATFTTDGNHEFVGDDFLAVNVTIMQSQITGTVEMNGAEFTYDGKEHKVLASVTAGGVTGVTYAYYAGDYTAAGATLPSALPVTGVTDAGTYTVVATFTVDGNYRAIDPIRVKVVVNKATVKVTADNVSKVYGYSYDANDFTYSAEGLYGSDTLASFGVTVTVNVRYDGTYGTDAGEYVINLTGAQTAGNYEFEYVDGKLTITPYVLSKEEIKWQKSDTDATATLEYDYDGNKHLPYAYAEVNGVKVAVIEVSGEQTNAGNGYVALAVKTDSANYALPADGASTTFTILPKPAQDLHIIWENTTVYYDGTAHAPSAYFTESVGGQTVRHDLTVTVNGTAGVINAGEYEAIATLSDPNYTLADVDGNTKAKFEILAARVFIEIGDVSVVYGEAQNANLTWSYRADSVKLGAAEQGISLGCDVTNDSPVGTYKIYGTFDNVKYSNYAVTFIGSYASGDEDNGACGVLTVTKATLDLSGISISGRKVPYNGSLQQLAITNPLSDVLDINCAYTLGDYGFGNGGVKNAGVYKVVISFVIKDETARANYNAVADVEDTFEIEKVDLTLKANDNEIVYGDEPAAAGIDFAVAGFVGGEDEKVLSGTVSYGFNYVRYQRVGKYVITASGLTSANYNVKFENGELTVAPRTITVIWYDEQNGNKGTEFNYNANGNTHVPYAVAGNVVNNDALTLTVTGGQSEAGIGYVAKVVAITGVGNGNYALPKDGGAQVKFNVLPHAYAVVWEATNFVYNGKAQLPKACYYTQYGGRVDLIVTADRYSADAGTYVATASLYPTDTTPITGELTHVFTIAKLDVEVVIDDASSEYGEEIVIDQNGWHYGAGGEFVDGNFISLKCSVKAGDPVGVYTGAITCDFANDNYNITYKNGTYTVVKKVLDIPEIAGVDYDGKPHKAEIDSGAPYYVASADASITLTDVGTCSVTLALTDPFNYVWRGTNMVTVIVPFSVNKVQNDWVSGYEFAVQGGTVEAGSGKIVFNDYRTIFESEVTVKYYRDAAHSIEVTEEYVTTNATDGARIYLVVTVAGTANFDEIVYETAITVTGKLKISLVWSRDPIIYNGTAQAPQAYVWIGSDRVLLEVEGAEVNSGTYTATAKKVALDGTDLSGYEFSNPDGDFTISFTIAPRKLTVSIDDDVTVVYGSVKSDRVDLGRLGWSLASGSLGTGDTLESLKITFAGIFGGNEYANVGRYAIVGNCANGNYDVEFLGAWDGGDEYDGKAGVYTVTPASMTIDKNGSEWFDEKGVIESFQSYFVTLGDRKPDDTAYEYINLKGDQSARVEIRYSNRAFPFENSSDIPEMTDAQIAQYIIEEQDKAPSIAQAGIWVVYYRIEAPNHQVKYGQWRVLILKNTDYIIVTFNPEKQYKVSYGDASGRNIIGELIDGGYVTLSGAIKDPEVLKLYANAYAYKDVANGETVDGKTGVNRYTIRFVLNERGMNNSDINKLEFKYKNTNDVNVPDSNIGAFEVVQRELGIKWGEKNFTYDGTAHKPSLTLTNLVGGGELEVEYELGKVQVIDLGDNGTIYLTVTEANGGNLVNAGNYRLLVEIENNNYRLNAATNYADVTIARQGVEAVWGDKDFEYDGAAHFPALTVGGKVVEYVFENGVCTVAVTLDNGDVINVTVTMDGESASSVGSYTLRLSIDNANYVLTSGESVTVTLTDSGRIGLPVWAIGTIAAGAAVAVITIAGLTVALKKRKKQMKLSQDEDGFNEDYEG